MYFPDLTPYEYGQTEPQPNLLNVGWLSAAQAFPPLASPTNGWFTHLVD
jgi:hypothetical protein